MNDRPRASSGFSEVEPGSEQRLLSVFAAGHRRLCAIHELLSATDLDELTHMQPGDLREVKLQLRSFVATLNEMFRIRGEEPPTTSHGEGIERFSLGRMRVYIQHFCSGAMEDIRFPGPPRSVHHPSTFSLLGLTFRAIEALRIIQWCEKAAISGPPLSGSTSIVAPPEPLQLTDTPPPMRISPELLSRVAAAAMIQPAPVPAEVQEGGEQEHIRRELSFAGLLDSEAVA